MTQSANKDRAKIKNLVAMYNMIANLFWSAVNLVPISVFCYRYIHSKLFFAFLIISLVSIFLPKSFFDSIQLGKTTYVYKKLGIGLVNRFAQNGELINKLVKKKYPDYKGVSNDKRSVNKLLQQTYIFEKFHFFLFLFFTFIIAFAVLKGYWLWAGIVFGNNLIYNVYPNFLQQYIRIRLAGLKTLS